MVLVAEAIVYNIDEYIYTHCIYTCMYIYIHMHISGMQDLHHQHSEALALGFAEPRPADLSRAYGKVPYIQYTAILLGIE